MSQAHDPGRILLTLRDVVAGYADHIVLDDVNLEIYQDDFLGLIGPNGSGKTTLLKIIMGLISPINGEIDFHGKRPVIGYLPQFSVKDRKFPISSFDVVLSGIMTRQKKGRKISSEHCDQVEQLFARLGIAGLENRSFGSLSGGQMQRVFLARALISSPELLVLDEPSTFVDTVFSTGFYELLSDMNSKMAIVLVSHELSIISSYVRNIACVNKTLHYHSSNVITKEILDHYECPIDILGHGDIPHRVLRKHGDI